jgi:hypothetical protein
MNNIFCTVGAAPNGTESALRLRRFKKSANKDAGLGVALGRQFRQFFGLRSKMPAGAAKYEFNSYR